MGDKALYILGPLYGEKRRDQLLLTIAKENIINAPGDTYSHLASCPCIITALGTTLQEVELLQKPCFIIANYTHDLTDFEAIKACSTNPKNYENCIHFTENFAQQLLDFVKKNQENVNSKVYDAELHNLKAASRWLDLLK